LAKALCVSGFKFITPTLRSGLWKQRLISL
jgi:hypothetical protein